MGETTTLQSLQLNVALDTNLRGLKSPNGGTHFPSFFRVSCNLNRVMSFLETPMNGKYSHNIGDRFPQLFGVYYKLNKWLKALPGCGSKVTPIQVSFQPSPWYSTMERHVKTGQRLKLRKYSHETNNFNFSRR